jgi:flagellar basal body-associated protein FliL
METPLPQFVSTPTAPILRPRKSRTKKVLIIILIVLLAACLAVLVYGYFFPKKATGPQPITEEQRQAFIKSVEALPKLTVTEEQRMKFTESVNATATAATVTEEQRQAFIKSAASLGQ